MYAIYVPWVINLQLRIAKISWCGPWREECQFQSLVPSDPDILASCYLWHFCSCLNCLRLILPSRRTKGEQGRSSCWRVRWGTRLTSVRASNCFVYCGLWRLLISFLLPLRCVSLWFPSFQSYVFLPVISLSRLWFSFFWNKHALLLLFSSDTSRLWSLHWMQLWCVSSFFWCSSERCLRLSI